MAVLDELPPPPPAAVASLAAPGDLFPRGDREAELCARAGHPDWAYLVGLVALDAGAVWFGSSSTVKYAGSYPSLSGPALIGLAWGATIGGGWLAFPKCSPHWVGEAPREGDVHKVWPLALSLALLAGATAPIVDAIAIDPYNLPLEWTTFDRGLHVIVAGVAGFGGALLPYLLPPRTWTAARELGHIRVDGEPAGGLSIGYAAKF